jgi:hypothetical protein
VTAEFWEYDSRIGRRWNLDPVVSPWESQYATFHNNPIALSDPYGDSPDDPKPPKLRFQSKKEKSDYNKAIKNDAQFKKRIDDWLANVENNDKTLVLQSSTNKTRMTLTDPNNPITPQAGDNTNADDNPNVEFLVYNGSGVTPASYSVFRVQYFERFSAPLIVDKYDPNKLSLDGKLSTSLTQNLFAYWSFDPYKEQTQRETKGGYVSILESIQNNRSRENANIFVRGTGLGYRADLFAMSREIYVRVPKGFFGYKWSQQVIGVTLNQVNQSRLQPGTKLREYSNSNDGFYDKVFNSN